MAGKESLQREQGLVEKYKGFNKKTRNIALAVAGGAAVAGAGFLIIPSLLWAGGDQIQISAIDKYKNRKNERNSKKLAQSATIIEFPKAGKQLKQKAA